MTKAAADISLGSALVFPVMRAKDTVGLRITPIGVVEGEKLRAIHDLTFSGGVAGGRKTRRGEGTGSDLGDRRQVKECRHGLGEGPGVSARRSQDGDYHADSEITGEVWSQKRILLQKAYKRAFR